MHTIECSKKLRDYLGSSFFLSSSESAGKRPDRAENDTDKFYSWSANLITMDRKNTIVLVNQLTRWTVIFSNIKKPDLKKIKTIITDGIIESLFAFGIDPEIIQEYTGDEVEIYFDSLKDRGYVARMNAVTRDIIYFDDLMDEENIFQRRLSAKMNFNLYTKPGPGNDYEHPYEPMLAECIRRWPSGIFKMKGYDVTVTLDLEIYKAVRRFIIPGAMNFQAFHVILQKAYSWGDSHLYRFEAKGQHGKKLKIEMDEEAYIFAMDDEEIVMAYETYVGDVFDNYNHINYIYDFGDNWVHEIKLNKVVDDYDKNHALLVDGENDGPPEDVGGVGGFLSYNEVLNDPEDPDHDEMMAWSRSQYWHKPYDPKEINRFLTWQIVGKEDKY